MFQVGKSYKAKVELSSGEIGFGRATLVEKQGNRFLVQLRTTRQANHVLPKGTKFWFVSDSAQNPFNGLWATVVTGSRIHSGKTMMECSKPKFEPVVQKRASERLSLSCPVKVYIEPEKEVPHEIFARNISKSGIGLEAASQDVRGFEVGEHVVIVIQCPAADISITCRVIRTQYNWLANRTSIGLEFVDMSDKARCQLQDLLALLGENQGDSQTSDGDKAGGLSSWMKSSHDNLRLIQLESQGAPGLSENIKDSAVGKDKPDARSHPDESDI